jgi:2-amino-4-hydroxy-6-hydroxymethyldihydropteridine diphosphokinase
MTSDQLCLIAIGANAPSRAGCPAATIDAALTRLSDGPGAVVAVSRSYRTPAFPPETGPDFVNAAAALRMPGDADGVLARLHEIEADFGRARGLRWGQRTLDLDLIAMGDAVRPDPGTFRHWQGLDADAQRTRTPDRLILPHPRMQDRAFVLVPLAEVVDEVAPGWRHPVLGRSVSEMLAALPQAEIDAVRTI